MTAVAFPNTFFLYGGFVKSLALFMLAGSALLLLRRSTPVLRFWVCLFAVAIPFLLTFLSIALPIGWLPTPKAHTLIPPHIDLPIQSPKPSLTPVGERKQQTNGPAPLLWLIGLALGTVVIVRERRDLRSLVRQSRPAAAARLLEIVETSAREIGLRRPVTVLMRPRGTATLTAGHRRPLLFFPENALDLSDEELRGAVLHELLHVRRADYLADTLALVLCVAYWFHPLVWIARARMRVECELACDERVVKVGVSRKVYATCLVKMSPPARPRLGGTLALVGAHDQMKTRVKAILGPWQRSQPMARAGAAVLLITGIGALIYLATWENSALIVSESRGGLWARDEPAVASRRDVFGAGEITSKARLSPAGTLTVHCRLLTRQPFYGWGAVVRVAVVDETGRVRFRSAEHGHGVDGVLVPSPVGSDRLFSFTEAVPHAALAGAHFSYLHIEHRRYRSNMGWKKLARMTGFSH